jgi:hypothetical protein
MSEPKFLVQLTEDQLGKLIDHAESMIGVDDETDPFYEELFKTLTTFTKTE